MKVVIAVDLFQPKVDPCLPVLDSVFDPELRPEGRLGLEEQAGVSGGDWLYFL